MSADNQSVLVLLVASNAESWLPSVIEGVRNQTHDEIEILAVDNASTDRSRALLEKAFAAKNVVSLDRRVGYGRALAAGLKVASERGTEHDAFLLLHDDAAMEPGTVEAMLRALERERVGVVGAKLVEWEEPERLQEVGLTTDRFGRLFNPLERGELDQGQHDGLKEVFFCSSACLLIGRDVIERVGLFDLRFVALRDDFDLCWRARIAGFRSVVTTDARVRHAAASFRGERPGPVAGRNRYFTERNMIASLLKNYSLPYLIVALPVTLAVSIMNVVIYLVSGRRIAARQTLAALQWNLVHLPSTLRARARAQRRRRTPDRDVVKLMVRGVPRVRSYVERALEQVVGEPAEGIDEEEDVISERSRRRLIDAVVARPLPLIAIVLVVVYLIGARHLFGSGGLAGTDMAPFPNGPGAFFTEFFSGWRSAGTGGAAPASPALFLSGLLSIVSFGSARLAERILVLSLLPLAGAAASKLGAAVGMPAAPRRVMAIAYALSPLALASFSQGRLPDLILIAALPALIIPPLRAGGLAAPGDWRSLATGIAGLAVVAAFTPWAIPAVAGASVVVGLAAAVVGGAEGIERGAAAIRVALTGVLQAAGAVMLLLPWSLELFKDGSPLGGRTGPFGVPITDLVRLRAGGRETIVGPIAWAFPVIAAAGVMLAVAARERVTRTIALASLAAVLLAWGVTRGVPWVAARPSLPLAFAAVGVALLIGAAAEGLPASLSARSFGAFHIAFGALALFGVAAAAVGVGFLGRGTYDGLRRAGDLAPAFFASEKRQLGDYRVLWVAGSQRALRADVSVSEGETLLTYLDRRAGGGERYLESALAAILARRTEQGGRLLAPLGIRYVVLRSNVDPDVVRAFARQVDVRFVQRFRGTQILSNEAWLSVGAVVASPRWIAASAAGPSTARDAAAALPQDPGRAGALRTIRPGLLAGRTTKGARAVLLAEEFSGRWHAEAGGRVIQPTRSFGWATAFAVGDRDLGSIVVRWRGQGKHRLALLVETALILLLAAAWSRRAARERGER